MNHAKKATIFILMHIFFHKEHLIKIRERRQLGFVTLNVNLAVNMKPTHPTLLNGKGQFTFLKTKL